MPERGSPRLPNIPLLGIQIINDMKAGVLTRSQLEEWNTQPWLAYETLEGRVNIAEPADKEFMANLQQWHKAGGVSEDPKVQAEAYALWAKEHVNEAQDVRFVINQLHDRTLQELSIAEGTKKEREKEAKGNILENAVQGTVDYIKEWQDHKVMTLALLATGYMLWKTLKGKPRVKKLLAWTIGIGAVSTLLYQKSGVKASEIPARAADNLGLEKVADGWREIVDTIKRPFGGPEGEKSELAYMNESMRITGENEQAMFRAFSTENPKQFFEWYDSAKAWTVDSGSGSPPPLTENVRREVSLMQNKGVLPPTFNSMDPKARTRMLLEVADKYFDKIGEYSAEEGQNNPTAYVKGKYVTGTYYDELYDGWLAEWKKEYGDEKGAYARVCDKTKQVIDFFKKNTINESDRLTFAQVLRLEMPDEDEKKLYAYNGKGQSLDDLHSALWTAASSAMDIAVNATKATYEYVTVSVPEAARKLWKEVIVPTAGNIIDQEKFVQWTNAFMQEYVQLLKNPSKTWQMAVDSDIAQALKAMGINLIETTKNATSTGYEWTKEAGKQYYAFAKEDAQIVWQQLQGSGASIKELALDSNPPAPVFPVDDVAAPPPSPVNPVEDAGEQKTEEKKEPPTDERLKPPTKI